MPAVICNSKIFKNIYNLIEPCADKSNVSTLNVKGMVVVCGLNPIGTIAFSNSLTSTDFSLKRT